MSISAGLVGLPNVGKSTLFNALTKSSVPAENYPFCTIDPHIACTPVPDMRLSKLLKIYKSEKIIPATVQFVDIAGLVKGAASGEGLGNQFLSNIKEVDLILHVIRCFEDPRITSVKEKTLDPLADYDIILTELILKDLDSIKRRKEKIAHLLKASKSNIAQTKELNAELSLLNDIENALNSLNAKKAQEISDQAKVNTIPLLSIKKFLIIANISEDDLANNDYKNKNYYKTLIEHFGQDKLIFISAKIEYELSQLDAQGQDEMRALMQIDQSGLDQVIAKTYKYLGLITFFTCGPKEIHAWPIEQGITIRQAAGKIHSDLERGFICAEIFNYKDLFTLGSIAKVKEAGKIRTEGQDYIVQDGDIVLVKFNV